MNKQELIEKYKSALNKVHKVYGDYYKTEAYEEVLEDLKQLDEPQKPVVKRFVADWYEDHKDNLEYNIWSYIYNWEQKEGSAFKDWIDTVRNKPIQTLVNMHQFGYTVEKEKRYLVKMKNLRALICYLAYIPDEGYWTLMASGGKSIVIKHTRKELEEAGFGEVFNSPLFEVEEVE